VAWECVKKWQHVWYNVLTFYSQIAKLFDRPSYYNFDYMQNISACSGCITHTRLTALFPGLPGWAGTRKAKPIWILMKQETVSGSSISWAICKSACRSRQVTMPVSHHSVFYRPDALPAAQPTASKHWRRQWLHHSRHISSGFNVPKIIDNVLFLTRVI